MGEPECIHIAAKMVYRSTTEFKSKYQKLYERLHNINKACVKTGGELRSRQVIATVLADILP